MELQILEERTKLVWDLACMRGLASDVDILRNIHFSQSETENGCGLVKVVDGCVTQRKPTSDTSMAFRQAVQRPKLPPCHYNSTILECDTWVPHYDYRYTCGLVKERDDIMGGGFRTPPTPDKLCVPVNDTCQWFNPCQYWREHSFAPYQCGTLDEYYSFIFGPTPLGARPPDAEQWVEPVPPGVCVVDQKQLVKYVFNHCCNNYSSLCSYVMIGAVSGTVIIELFKHS